MCQRNLQWQPSQLSNLRDKERQGEDMSCFKDLAMMVKQKCGEDKVMDMAEWALGMLEQSDHRSYDEIINKMEKLAYSISKEDAEQIVRGMRPRGEVWSYEQVKDYIATHGVTDKCVEYYLAMNMAKNDYFNTASRFNAQDDVEFYFSIANDFINDIDADNYKIGRYFSRK